MSGRSLFPLTIEMCNRISRQFGGKMRISFAGGADYFNCDKLFAAGIWPITVATTILKSGGYNRLHQMVEKVEPMAYRPFSGTDTQAICQLSAASHTDVHHVKPIKPLPSRKSDKQVPSPAPSAPTGVRPSAPGTSMTSPSASGIPSCWLPKRATTP